MASNEIVQAFENSEIRSVWVEEEEEWYFSIVDVVQALTDSSDPKQYVKRMRGRDEQLNLNWGTICTPLRMKARDGKMREVQAANSRGILRIIQSIPSKKAEPFKLWLAEVGAQRIDEEFDPEIAIDRAMQTYLRKGYSPEWVDQRMRTLSMRKDLTDEWRKRGVSEPREFAILTDDITKAWSGMTTRQYKTHKGLTKENLRDNMSSLELAITMLGEATTAEISRQRKPETFDENREVAKDGGEVARGARELVEQQTGVPVVTSGNAETLGLTSGVEEPLLVEPSEANGEV